MSNLSKPKLPARAVSVERSEFDGEYTPPIEVRLVRESRAGRMTEVVSLTIEEAVEVRDALAAFLSKEDA